ncbi:MAG TPA: hypothetical protein VNQ90_09065 [Chthoniobacteraceae bacterium]|nr:hypothetical protein [Chthoniobacteraceae bacterium]
MNLSPLLVKWTAAAVVGVGTSFAAGYQWASLRSAPSEVAASGKTSAENGPHAPGPLPSGAPAASNTASSARAGAKEALASALSDLDSHRRIKRFRRLLIDLKPEEFPGAFEELVRSGTTRDWQQIGLLSEFLGDWAEHDPVQAFEKARHLKIMAQLRPYLAGQVLGVLARRDPDAALALLEKEPRENQRLTMRATLIGAVAETDPARARALLKEYPEVARGNRAYTLFSQWASRNPLDAIDAAYQLGSGAARQQALQAIGMTWASTDPQAAEAWVNTLPAGKARDQLWLNLVQRKAFDDPEATVESLLRADIGESTRRQGMQSALMAWGQQDRDAALAFVLEEANPRLSQSVLPVLLNQWMETDAPSAIGWLRQHGSEAGGTALIESTARTVAFQSPEEAMPLIGELPAGETRQQLYRQVASSLAENDPGAARAYWEKMPPGPERDQYQQGMLTGMAAQDPERAMREVDSLPGGAVQDRLRQSLMTTLVDTDPKMAIEWAAKAPEKSRGAMLGTAVTTWANSDPYAASAWLATLPKGAPRDQAVSQFAGSVVRSDPQGAATWALSITDEKLRTNAIRRVASQWKRADEAAAKQWIEGVDLPEKMKASLLK